MIPLPLPPKIIKKGKNQALFEIENLYPGYGVTVGNALRRVLLSSLEGVAVTEAKIKGVSHEFSTISGVLEDVIMILLNLKKLRFKIHEGGSHRLSLNVKGEKDVKGSDFKLSPEVELVNPDVHIATATDKKTELDIEIQIEKGLGYEPKELRKAKKEKIAANAKPEIGIIVLDAIFTPVKNVNFHVESMRVGDRTDFDRLSLEIEADGVVAPEEAFFEACDLLLKHFNVIFEGKAHKKETAKEKTEAGEGQDLTKMNVEDLKLSGRTLNALLKNNIKTAGGLLRKSEKSLQELEGMGEKAILEIKKKLKKLGLEIKSSEE
ncbi:MAG: DNA-directed RNA polymerase subunit alpha [Candidatus Staskawiczbacteria bacterium]|nr:DNA-directed RNA polymerase subunit alpha [Candidatus Staskawiczbacteria bacterium]